MTNPITFGQIRLSSFNELWMGRYQRASLREGCILVLLAWKGVRRVVNFLLQFFVPIFSYTIFKQFFNISAAQNKNYLKKLISD